MSDLSETIHSSLVKSRHNLLFDALPQFDRKPKADMTLITVVSLLRIGPHSFTETKLHSAIKKETRGRQAGTPRSDAFTSTTPPTPSILIEFKESASNFFVVPTHFIFDLLPLVLDSPHPTQQPVLLSFFVSASETRKGKEKAVESVPEGNENGVDAEVLIPFSLILEGLDDAAKNTLYQASRTARPRDDQLEKWWKEVISSVGPRTHIDRTFDPPEPPLEVYEEQAFASTGSIPRPRFGAAVSNLSNRSSSPAPRSNRRKSTKKRARPRPASVRSRLSTTFPGEDLDETAILTTRRASKPSAKALLAAKHYVESDDEDDRSRRESSTFLPAEADE